MTEFTLDTSGFVSIDEIGNRPLTRADAYCEWPDLDPFTQGYVEALLISESDQLADSARERAAREDDTIDLEDQPEAWRDAYRPGFSDLAPETLAAILKDCGAAQAIQHMNLGPHYNPNSEGGRCFWADRQSDIMKRFPPLIVYLGDDGKVHIRPA